MRILHAPFEVASNMFMTAKAQRERGHDVTSLELGTSLFCNGDIMLHTRGPKGVRSSAQRERIWSEFAKEHFFSYDIYHFYYLSTFYADHSDLEMLRKAGKQIVMTCCGSDFVNHSEEMMQHFVDRAQRKESPKPPMMRPEQYERVAFMDRYVHAFVANSSRIDHLPRLALMKRTQCGWVVPVDVAWWDQRVSEVSMEDKDPNKVYLLHAPSNRLKKGTEFILPVFERLKKEGYPIEIILVECVHPSQVHHYYAKADIVVDQLLLGNYGEFAIQMMALGKPVVLRFEPYMRVHHGYQPPVVHADLTNLYETLVRLIENKEERETIGRESRAYVQHNHDYKQIGQDLLELYDDLLHHRPIVQLANPDFYSKKIREIFPNPITAESNYQREIIDKRLNNFDCYYELARHYKLSGQIPNAITMLQRCVELKPDFFEGWSELAMYYLDRFHYQQATDCFQQCLKLKPETSKKLLDLARQRSRNERYHDAITLLNLLSQNDPNHATYPFAIGTIYETLTLWNRAELAYKEALERDPQHPLAQKNLDEVLKKKEEEKQGKSG